MRNHPRAVRIASATVLVLASGLGAATLRAHHSTADYDATTFVEARGEVTKVLWQNPHVRLEISTARFDGVSSDIPR